MQHHIGDDAHGNAFGDAVEQRHGDDGQIRRDGFGHVILVEADFGDGGDHQVADHHQRRSSRERRDRREDRRKEHGSQEQQAGGQRRQTRATADSHAGSGLDEGGDGRSAHHSADSGADGIRHERRLDARQAAFLVEHIGLGSHADEGAEGIKDIHEQEGEDDDDEIDNADVAEIHVEALAEGQTQLGEIRQRHRREQRVEAVRRIRHINACHLAEYADDPGRQNAQQDRAAHMMDVQRRHDEQADQRQQRADTVRVEVFGEARNRHQRGGIDRQTGVLQADEADEQADTDGNAALERQRDGVEDGLAHIRQAQHNEDQALDEDGQQRDLPGVAHAQHDGVGQERVQTHACGQRERQVRHQAHARRADEGRQRRCQQNGGGVHARGGQDARVNGQNVGHRHECGDTRHDFGLGGGFVFAQLKNLFKHSFHSLLFSSFVPPRLLPGETVF